MNDHVGYNKDVPAEGVVTITKELQGNNVLK
jgi:hypothetical protein